MTTGKAYAAIRKDFVTGEEVIELRSIKYSSAEVHYYLGTVAASEIDYDKDNPVIRIAVVTIVADN